MSIIISFFVCGNKFQQKQSKHLNINNSNNEAMH